MDPIIESLLASQEPSIRFKTLVNVLGRDAKAPSTPKAQRAILTSSHVRLLLSERDKDGRIPLHPYSKWRGAHWVLSCLADIGYPPGDDTLIPLREQTLDWLFSRKHEKRIICLDRRTRRCASQEGNALFSLLALGIADGRADELANRLIRWQWPDGGWNCDKRPEAINSSFMETLIPLRALALYAKVTGHRKAKQAVERAAEVFLKRRLFKRQHDGTVIDQDFTKLHYPSYWHYDILFGLKVIAEAGFIRDKRCSDALDLLEAKRLPDGGFPAEGKYYRVSDRPGSGRSAVDWGGTGKHANEWVTVDALYLLRRAGRKRKPVV